MVASRVFIGQLIFIGIQDRPASENQNSQPWLTVPNSRIRSRFHALCSTNMVAFDGGANAQEAGGDSGQFSLLELLVPFRALS